jgi:predicted lipase
MRSAVLSCCFVLLLAATLVDAQYSSTTAMSALYYCKTSYCNVQDIQSWDCGSTCNFHSGFAVKGTYRNSSVDSQGFSGLSSDGKIVVAFRGSSNIKNWIADLDFTKVQYPACSGCEVHKGFYEVYLSMCQGMLADVQALISAHPGSPILVTGHSLGAAVAVHAAVDIMSKISGVGSLELYNFGDPRVGNPAFAAWVPTVLPQGKQFRVTHAADPVPHVPPMVFGFLHAPHELWYNNDGSSSWKDCQDSPTSEDDSCSDSTIPIDIDDHLLYLGICTECSC